MRAGSDAHGGGGDEALAGGGFFGPGQDGRASGADGFVEQRFRIAGAASVGVVDGPQAGVAPRPGNLEEENGADAAAVRGHLKTSVTGTPVFLSLAAFDAAAELLGPLGALAGDGALELAGTHRARALAPGAAGLRHAGLVAHAEFFGQALAVFGGFAAHAGLPL
ncbi:MAG: hypothetical protein AB1426_12590, partial [Bacillota bacterium]